MLVSAENRLSDLIASKKSDDSIVEELYWAALSRSPREAERTKALRLFETAKDRRAALEDLAWALLNSKEFVLRR